MQEEIEYRTKVLRPKLIEEVQIARGFGDLSENFEYKAAKQEKNRNDSRIRYLQRMIATAHVIDVEETGEGIGLFDKVEILAEGDEEVQKIQIVTTLRQNPLLGLISKESPVGKAIMGHRAGDKVHVTVSEDFGYDVEIKSVEKGEDDDSLEISRY
jgi:transcription elongation factor GreA